MKRIYFLIATVVLLFTVNHAFAASTYYFKATAVSTNSSAGKVYVAASNAAPAADQYEDTKSATGSGSSKNKNFYYFAQPESGYEFVGWATTDTTDPEQVTSTANPYTLSCSSNVTDKNAAPQETTLYALFAEATVLYSSSLTATADGNGEVSVSKTTTPSFAQNSTESYTDEGYATHRYYLVAKPNNVDFDEFMGWYNGEVLLSSNLSYTYEIEVSTPDEPTNVNVTAKFESRNPYQFRNASFERWNSKEPIGWHGPKTAIGSMAGMASGSAPAPAMVEEGHTGKAVRIISKSVIGVNANGNLTTGVMNMGSMSAANASNNNHTVIDDPDFHLVINGQPDSIIYYAKFKRGGQGDYCGQVAVHMHDTCDNFQDPLQDSQASHLMAKAIAIAPESAEWTRCAGAFDYEDGWDYERAQSTTKFILCDFTTNPTPGATEKDTLILDDVMFVYNSHLDSVLFANEKLQFENDLAEVNALYDENRLTYFKGGRGAQLNKDYNAATGLLTITVIGQDIDYNPGNQHVYYIQFSLSETYTRTVRENYYGTICLPALVSASNRSGAEFYTVAGTCMNGEQVSGIVLEEVDENADLEAGTPYIFKATANQITCTMTGTCADVQTVNALVGNLSAEAVEVPNNEENYILKDNQLHYVGVEGVYTGANRAYFTLSAVSPAPSAARRIVLSIEGADVATSLEDADANATIDWNQPVYNVLGQRVAEGTTGVLIQNGLKLIVR